MAEMIKTYLLNNPDVLVPMDREAFYAEQIKRHENGEKPNRAVEIVNIFLFNEIGELFVQKRSMEKRHNPGLLDKSIGGHVSYGDQADYTVTVETVQELQVPSIVLRSDGDFLKTYQLLRDYLNTLAIVKHVSTADHTLIKRLDGKDIPILNRVHLYAGLYGGRVKTIDREAKGVLQYTLDDLEREMTSMPQMFTDDLSYYMEHFGDVFRAFVKQFVD